jgi:inner membrane protein
MEDRSVEILGMSFDLWVVLGLLAFSVIVTLGTNWLVARFRHAMPGWGRAPGAILASVIWIALVTAAGLLAVRYIERIDNAAVGYLLFGLGAFLLSLLRAFVYHPPPSGVDALSSYLVHNLLYLLVAASFYLALSWLSGHPAEPLLLIPLFFGALLPDLDTHASPLGRLVPFISRRLEAWLGHGQELHTPAAAALVALVTAPLLLFASAQVWYVMPLGFLSHLIVDMLAPQGLMLFWPITRRRYFLFGFLSEPGGPAERRLAAGLIVVLAALLLVVDWGPEPAPPVAQPTYEQNVERYYSLRGRNRVFARIEGSWQATGRRWSAYLEILNATGESFTLWDSFTGEIFTAGRTPEDNFYLSSISLVTGEEVRVKPVEVNLENQRLADALPVVYQMQREPGLLYIYISGDVITPDRLHTDYAQTSLRKVQAQDTGQYTLHYLTAAEFIELAAAQVERADLTITATYATSPAGPTATPLPTPAMLP